MDKERLWASSLRVLSTFFFFFYSRGLRPENVYKAIGILGSWVVEESFLLGLKRAASMSLEVLVGNQSTSCNQARKEKKMKNVSSRHILLLYLGTHKKAPSASRPSTVFLPTFLPPGTRPFNSTFYGHLRCRSSLFPALASSGEPLLLLLHGFFFSFFFCLLLGFFLSGCTLLPVAASNNLLHNNQKKMMTSGGYLRVCVQVAG